MDLREEVAKALYAAMPYSDLDGVLSWDALADKDKADFYYDADVAIAVVLEAAAKAIDVLGLSSDSYPPSYSAGLLNADKAIRELIPQPPQTAPRPPEP